MDMEEIQKLAGHEMGELNRLLWCFDDDGGPHVRLAALADPVGGKAQRRVSFWMTAGSNAKYVLDELDGEGMEGVGWISGVHMAVLRWAYAVVRVAGQVLRREWGEDQLRHGGS